MKPEDTANDAGLLVRDAATTAKPASGERAFTGIAVPWDTPIDLYGDGSYVEQFARGSVQDSDDAKVFYRHGEVIGRITAARDTDAGWEIDAILADTTLGRDAYALLQSGSIDKLSVGFRPNKNGVRQEENGTYTMTNVKVPEVSLVPHAAYTTTTVSDIRNAHTPKGSTMETDTLTRADIDKATEPLNTALTDLQRSMDLLKDGQQRAGTTVPEFRSMGEFLKAIAEGDDKAAEFHRAYTGGTTADAALTDTFVGDFIKLVKDRRRIINHFTTGTLPAKGMNIDYVKLLEDGTVVGKQLAEGDDLPYGNVKLGRDTAPVETYGGWTDLSKQLIERSDEPVLTTTLEAMGIKYGRVTNNAVATTYADLITERLSAYNDTTTPDATAAVNLPATQTADEWLDMIVDAALHYENIGFSLTGLDASVDVFKKLLRLKDGDRRIMQVYGQGSNVVGELNLSQVSGNLAGVRVELLPNVTGNVASFYDPVAIKTLESPGAPARLQDENIINLTKQFSIYGNMAVLTPFPAAVLPVNFAV